MRLPVLILALPLYLTLLCGCTPTDSDLPVKKTAPTSVHAHPPQPTKPPATTEATFIERGMNVQTVRKIVEERGFALNEMLRQVAYPGADTEIYSLLYTGKDMEGSYDLVFNGNPSTLQKIHCVFFQKINPNKPLTKSNRKEYSGGTYTSLLVEPGRLTPTLTEPPMLDKN